MQTCGYYDAFRGSKTSFSVVSATWHLAPCPPAAWGRAPPKLEIRGVWKCPQFLFFCAGFPFDATEHVWFSPRSFKEMKSPNPNKSFDKVMAVIAILALIGFVVGLFKIMG